MNEKKIEEFAQKVYLAGNGRYFDNLQGVEGQNFIKQAIDWCNQFIDELEVEADWNYVRENDRVLGTAPSSGQNLPLPSNVRKLAVDENRSLVLVHDGAIVSSWDVVDPSQLARPDSGLSRDRVTTTKRNIIFSRPLRDHEVGANVVADAIEYIPRLASNNTQVFDVVEPYQLLVLGTVKNVTLPDMVQGPLSPSFTQKYADLLENAKAENEASSVAPDARREDYGYIGGIY